MPKKQPLFRNFYQCFATAAVKMKMICTSVLVEKTVLKIVM